MRYKLAKKLKDAGFSLPTGSRIEIRGGSPNETSQEDFSTILLPTLSELIETYGEDFQELYKDRSDNTWRAKDKNDNQVSGFTPEEAVANLWLELNKK